MDESEGQNSLKKVVLIVLFKVPGTTLCEEKNFELHLYL